MRTIQRTNRASATPLAVSVYRVYHPNMSSREVIRRLVADGWQEVRSKGSHRQFKHPTKAGLVTVPHPQKDLPRGTLRSIFKQAGLE